MTHTTHTDKPVGTVAHGGLARGGDPSPLTGFLAAAASRDPNATALQSGSRKLSFAALEMTVDKLAAGLAGLGDDPCAPIAILLPHTQASLPYVMAALSIGAPIVPLDREADMRALIDRARASGATRLITCDREPWLVRAAAIAQASDVASLIVLAPAAASWRAFIPNAIARDVSLRGLPAELARRVTSERALLRDASGPNATRGYTPPAVAPETTALITAQMQGGRLRVARMSHATIAAAVDEILVAHSSVPAAIHRGQVILAALPQWHPLSIMLALALGIKKGGTWRCASDHMPRAVAASMARSRPGTLVAPVALVEALLLSGEVGPLAAQNLMSVVVVDGHLSAPARVALIALAPKVVILDGWATTIAPTFIAWRGGAIGLPAHTGTTVVIRDQTDVSSVLPRGERGEVCVFGPAIVDRADVEPADDLFIDGALRTGLIGAIDGHGDLMVFDAVDDLIHAAGYAVSAARIETALRAHPAIIEAAVIAVADADRGAAPKAFVVARRGAALTERDVGDFLAARISRIEMPVDIDFCRELPHDALGRVDKDALRVTHYHQPP